MASANTTTDHDEIRRWVEARGGYPAHVTRTESGDDPGVLRIDYPGYSGQDTLGRIEWDQFFEWFDRDNLAFLYQDEGDSRFSKFVSRESASRSRASSKKSASKKASSTKKASASKKATSSKASSSKKASSAKKASSKKAASSKKTSSKKASSSKKA